MSGNQRIGEVSRRTGVNIETIRYYEREGLVPPPPRTRGGTRVYGDDHVKRLAFIRRARELGFVLAEIRSLLALVDQKDFTCDQVRDLTLAHADMVRSKIADLRKVERVLRDMAAQCDQGAIPDCPVIEALSSAVPTKAASR